MEFRRIIESDAQKVKALIDEMNANLQNKAWFLTMPGDIEKVLKMINKNHYYILGAFEGEDLAGIASLDYENAKLPENYAFPKWCDVNQMVNFSFSIVSLKYRGKGLMFEMLKEIYNIAISQGFKYACCTVHKDNYPSLKNLLKVGFKYYMSINQNSEFPRDIMLMELKKMKIVVCSKNSAKNDAVKNVMKDYFVCVDQIALETDSGVSETPIGDDEGIEGCLNRIRDALCQDPNADLYVAMEGILSKTKYGTFLCGWTVIYNKSENEHYYGCSAKVKIPDEIVKSLDKTQRLSDIVAKDSKRSENEISILGTNGLLTNGEYTRTDEFSDSISCAISTKYLKLASKKGLNCSVEV